MPKNWWASKTLWFNAVSLLAAVFTLAADPTLVNDPRIVGVAAAVVTLGNTVLRLITAAPIAGTPAAAAMLAAPPHTVLPPSQSRAGG